MAFANSGAAAAQPAFLRGLALLHNFQYPEAAEAFQEAQRIDSSFAMAYWGEATTYNHGVWVEQDSVAARAVIGRLAALPNARTTRERGFIDAVETLYAPGKAKESRDTAYASAMQRLAARDTNDVEAQLFYSLALLYLFRAGHVADGETDAWHARRGTTGAGDRLGAHTGSVDDAAGSRPCKSRGRRHGHCEPRVGAAASQLASGR